jgi:hypothetical protein
MSLPLSTAAGWEDEIIRGEQPSATHVTVLTIYIGHRIVVQISARLEQSLPMANLAISQTSSWQELVVRKQAQCQEKIPREWTLGEDLVKVPPRLLGHDLPRLSGLLSELELELTENYSATQLLAKLASGQVSSLVVTTAFCKRAAIAQQVVSIALASRFSRIPAGDSNSRFPCRRFASQRLCFRKLWTELDFWMSIFCEKAGRLGRSMDCLSA